MKENKVYCSRSYWSNYIDSIIDSIKEDKDTIIDMLVYGHMIEVDIIVSLSPDRHPSYEVRISKMAEKSPFREEEDGE